jgi:hypothetical protein
MSIQASSVSAAQVAAPAANVDRATPSEAERWTAWDARGVAHDRAVRRKMTIAVSSLLVVAAAIVYALLGR